MRATAAVSAAAPGGLGGSLADASAPRATAAAPPPPSVDRSIESVVAAMAQHAGDAVALGAACLTFQCLELVRATAAGAIEATVLAMRAHGGDPFLQLHGCGALCALTLCDAAACLRAVVAGAVEAVAAAMQAHAAEAVLQIPHVPRCSTS
jgi:hypothetical protein